jgi:urease subunit alpha
MRCIIELSVKTEPLVRTFAIDAIKPVEKCREIGKANMLHNDATPRIDVDPETYEVRADGELLTCEPAQILPMAQRCFLF